ncbi:hypothetical protein OZN62_09210 [Aurantiacibacter sp. MUD11]|uniref:hypothetical protein n=1 Tax=Aurantiacibacter sp. MUD11 TaxID=3003265 RepID=UPI0022AABBC4|nr:hypothetical protein [Aurantiacibacter sp. MUD11]WAT17114.1 hypothetical protein OZN62_09210 [Aurantiacibacter sp. MUD11]
MAKTDTLRTISAVLAAGGIASMIGATQATDSSYFEMLLYGGGIAFAVGGVGLIAMLIFGEKPEQQPVAIDHSVTSHNQSGGITAQNVNVGKIQRRMSPRIANEMLQSLPKDRAIRVEALLGDAEAIRYATEIRDFLKANGYILASDHIAQVVRRDSPEGIQFFAADCKLLVGANDL